MEQHTCLIPPAARPGLSIQPVGTRKPFVRLSHRLSHPRRLTVPITFTWFYEIRIGVAVRRTCIESPHLLRVIPGWSIVKHFVFRNWIPGIKKYTEYCFVTLKCPLKVSVYCCIRELSTYLSHRYWYNVAKKHNK